MDPGSTAAGEVILAIDAGTQSVRAGLVDLAGEIRALVKIEVEPYFSERPGWAEQDPQYYWRMLCEACRKVLEGSGWRERIVAVTLTTQRSTLVNVDADGKPLRPAIVWLDSRKADANRILPPIAAPLLKPAQLFPVVEYALRSCRSNWIRQNQPAIWERTHKFLFLSGYLTHRMTGEFRDSYGNILGPIPFNLRKGQWSGKWDLSTWLFPIEPEKLPELVPPSGTLGRITKRAAEETGIPQGLPVIAASNDKACDIIGAGCLTPQRACISFGTTATINTHNTKYVELLPFLPPYPSAIPDHYYSEVTVVRGLWMVSWFKEEFGLQERQQALQEQVAPEELLEKLLKDVPAGSMGLVCQPYWTPGPEVPSCTRGAVIGFSDIHNRAYLYRAIVEGIIFALRQGAELTEKKNKVRITELFATGGGSRSDSIMQMTADIFGLAVSRPHTNETSVLGAAIDAAVGLGLFADFEAAVAAMTRTGAVFTPARENRETYDEIYRRVYLKMHGRLLPLYRQLQAITGYPDK